MSTAFEALILAGGASKRFGRPKAFIEWNGIPLWQHIAGKIAPVATRVSLVGFPQKPTKTELALANFIEDSLLIGPLGGIALGLQQASTANVLVVACDMPFITAAAILELQQHSLQADIVVPETAEGIHPLFAFYARSACLSAINAALARGERQMRSFYQGLRVKKINTNENSQLWHRVLTNINTATELAEANRLNNLQPPV